MALYRKLNRETRVRRSILSSLTKDVLENGHVETTEERAEELEVLEAEIVDSSNEVSNAEKEKIQEEFKEEAKKDTQINQEEDEESSDDETTKNDENADVENTEPQE